MRVRGDKRLWAIGAFVVCAIAAIGFAVSRTNKPEPAPEPPTAAAPPPAAPAPPAADVPPEKPPAPRKSVVPKPSDAPKTGNTNSVQPPEPRATDPLPPLVNRDIVAETRVAPAHSRSVKPSLVTLPPGSQGVVRVSLEPPQDEGEYRGYVAEVISDKGDSIMGHAWGPKGKPSLVLNVDARRMQAGGYRVRLHGFTETGRRRPVADYYFEVQGK